MIPNPIRKVLSTLATNEVRYLLMGGQACVLYGAAEFSRDCDIAILCESANLDRFKAAIRELDAEPIAVPPFQLDYLLRGHAVHFRCQASDAAGIRLDVMAKMRGVAPFDELWQRRTTIIDDANVAIDVMALNDLVTAKKTQRDKDWPMIRRLIEANFATRPTHPDLEQLQFWLSEARTPEVLIEVARIYPELANSLVLQRPLLASALAADRPTIVKQLAEEELAERHEDELYWRPLRLELEQLRRDRLSS